MTIKIGTLCRIVKFPPEWAHFNGTLVTTTSASFIGDNGVLAYDVDRVFVIGVQVVNGALYDLCSRTVDAANLQPISDPDSAPAVPADRTVTA